MPKIEIRQTQDEAFPFAVIEEGRIVDSFATYQGASDYRDNLKKWWRNKNNG